MTTETHVINRDRMMLDHLLWERFRRRTPGLVEKTLALNPGLADLGPFLPRGTRVVVPIEPADQMPVMQVHSLWD